MSAVPEQHAALVSVAELSDVLAPNFETLRAQLDTHSYSASLLRALMVLAALPAAGDPARLTDIAALTGLPSGTSYRYLKTWTLVGLVEREALLYRRISVRPRKRRTH